MFEVLLQKHLWERDKKKKKTSKLTAGFGIKAFLLAPFQAAF